MIVLEVCYINGLSDQNINIAKCILKLRQAAALPGSDTWIRINPNYVRTLDSARLIQKSPVNKNFVQLTQLGQNVLLFHEMISMSLEQYFAHEDNIPEFIEDSLMISVTEASYKVMHNICHSCGKVKKTLNHIVDEKNNDGMYCNQCLDTIGYTECWERANSRRNKAQYAFSIR